MSQVEITRNVDTDAWYGLAWENVDDGGEENFDLDAIDKA